MKNKQTIKKIIIGLVVAIALLVVYSFLSSSEGTKPSSQGSLSSLAGMGSLGQVQNTDVSLANSEILKILGNIRSITLNDDIFSNPVFRSLQDSRFIILKPTRIGRPNPFLPIGFDVVLPSISIPEIEQPGDFFDTGEDPAPLDGGESDGGDIIIPEPVLPVS